ncbi:MAG: AAA family ATPase, partial [Clostridia bacterium]|nr:AAA family ATPase [Clostridia bacterium]
MYLKTLEISGFKSFPDKTKIEFGRGITSIVGPNGSGKSNISDAIRWVLGEQSTKTLRGGKMEDVIFAGTRLRKGSNYAEVSLTIDNSAHFLKIDYDEVVIARRYYRSGESDYFINKKNVRLKDINELLMDTGLGRDGYSMIGQGRIDEVLTKKSTERRDMFEEAAGISKFKYRKEETERKLNATEENLIRIRDILTEVEARYIPLEKKAEKAKKYLVLRDELRGLEISLWVDNLRDMKEKTEKLHRDLNLASFALEEARIASEKAYAASEETMEKMRLLEMEEEEKRGELRLVEGELATSKSELSALETSIRLNDENAARVEGEIDAGQNRTGEIDASIRENLDKIEEIEGEKAELLTRIKTLRENLEALSRLSDEKGAKTAVLQAGLVDARMEKSTGETELNQLLREAEAIAERADQLAAERIQVEKAYTEQKARTEESRKKIQTARSELQSLENMQKGYRLRYDSRKARVDEVKLKLERALEEKNRAT